MGAIFQYTTMALSVDYCYKYVLNLIRKNQAGGLGNEEFENMWNGEQTAYQDDILGRFQARNNGKTGLNTGLIEDETILQKLSPFISTTTLTVTSGATDKPTDFVFRTSLMVSGYNCYKVNHNQRDAVNHSVIDAPSVTDNRYYFLEYEDYYEFLPSTVTSAVLNYVKTPPNVKWGFIYDADGRQVYNSGTSIQPLWDNSSTREICKRVLKSIGVSFKDADFENFGQQTIISGD